MEPHGGCQVNGPKVAKFFVILSLLLGLFVDEWILHGFLLDGWISDFMQAQVKDWLHGSSLSFSWFGAVRWIGSGKERLTNPLC